MSGTLLDVDQQQYEKKNRKSTGKIINKLHKSWIKHNENLIVFFLLLLFIQPKWMKILPTDSFRLHFMFVSSSFKLT